MGPELELVRAVVVIPALSSSMSDSWAGPAVALGASSPTRCTGGCGESSPHAERSRRWRPPGMSSRSTSSIDTIDAAFLDTIHGFADRLLRLLPMKAPQPVYLSADDIDVLVDETVEVLVHAVHSGTLGAELASIWKHHALRRS